MSHPVLEEHPAIVAHRRKREELAEAEARWRERSRRTREAYSQALERWRAGRDRALLSGEPIPAQPEEPVDDPDAAAKFLRAKRELADEERSILPNIGDEVLDAAEARERELLAEARKLLAELEPIADELHGLISVAARIERASGVIRERVRTVDVHRLIEAARFGEKLVRPEGHRVVTGMVRR